MQSDLYILLLTSVAMPITTFITRARTNSLRRSKLQGRSAESEIGSWPP